MNPCSRSFLSSTLFVQLFIVLSWSLLPPAGQHSHILCVKSRTTIQGNRFLNLIQKHFTEIHPALICVRLPDLVREHVNVNN